MRFINPQTDYAFKKIFGSEQSQDILISFLNAILYNGEEIIQDLEILNPYSPGANFTLKDTYLDVKARLNNNTTVLIEMQILNLYAFDKRVIYNAAKSYANQLESGERYLLLNPVIALTIVNFILFPESSSVINHFLFKNTENNLVFNREIELVFLELPKFEKSLEELETIGEKWIYFLRKAPDFREKPESMAQISALNHALEIANRANLTIEELEDIQKRAVWLTDQEGIALKAKEMGLEEGRAEGRAEGLEQGRTEGLKTGKIELILRIGRRKFGELSSEIMDQIEQLSLEDLEQLGEEIVFLSSLENLFTWLDQR